MEQIRRRQLERAQYRMLKSVWKHLNMHPVEALDDARLAELGVVRSTDLDIDSPTPLDFEPRFFAPCHGEVDGLEDELESWSSHWRPSLDDGPEGPYADEWIPNTGYVHCEMRLGWFDSIFHGLRLEYEGETHPVNTYKELAQEDVEFASPVGYCGIHRYMPASYMMPTAPDKPHMGINMLSPILAPEGKMLGSELKAAIVCLWARNRYKDFTNHHTKPVIVFTFQRETHGRITQAHVDAKSGKVVIRQSRQLDLVGAPGQPPPDAYLLLRWLLNSPVGATEYEDGDIPGEMEMAGGPQPGATEMPVSPNVVRAKAG